VSARLNYVCVNVGPRYGMEYVAILRDQVLRNATQVEAPCAFWCLTDRPDELPEGVYPIPAPEGLPGWWAKVALFSPDMPWAEGDRIIYFDLDVAITGRLEELAERKGIIWDFNWPMFNSSVMAWDHGDHRAVWENFIPEVMERPSDPDIAPLLPKGQINGGDQEYLTRLARERVDPDPWETFPGDWFRSYRDCHAWPPNGCKAVIFHGSPKPSEVTAGWVPNVWKLNGFTSFPEFKGANTTEDHRMENVASACAREHLPWFTGFRDEGSACVIVGGAPSMLEHLSDIRWHARQKKTRIVTVNNAWRVLAEHGVTPDAHVILDARADNAEFLNGAPKGMRLLLASQCHPDVFDAAEATGAEIAVWHCAFGDNDALWKVLEPWKETKPIILVPGGSTVGLRAMWLAVFSGFRTLRMYGVDSSYADNGDHHAYPQALNDGETVLEVARGAKRYRCAPWMVRQAAEFEEQWREYRRYVDFEGKPAPVTVHVHGVGLIPDIARGLRDQQREIAA